MRKTISKINYRKLTAGLSLAVIIAFLLISPISTAYANDNDGVQGTVPVVQPPVGTPAPGGSTDPSTTATSTPTTGTIVNLLKFDFKTLKDALVNSAAQMLCSFLSGRECELIDDGEINPEDELLEVAGSVLSWASGADKDGGMLDQMEDLRKDAWTLMLRISLILVPLSLILSLTSAMKDGVSSVVSYANAKEAIIQWVFSVALMASSLFLINLAITASQYISSAIFDTIVSEQGLSSGKEIVNAFMGGGVFTVQLMGGTNLVVGLFLLLFRLFSLVTVVGTIVISAMAQSVGLLLMTAIAPLLYVLSAMKPLAWLKGLWLKIVSVLVLLGPVNMLLVTLGGIIVGKVYSNLSFSPSAFGSKVFGMLAAIGVMSLLIAINGAAGKMVYGAAIEIAQKAWGATKTVVALAAGAVAGGAGLAAGAAGAGAAGGAEMGASEAAANAAPVTETAAAANTTPPALNATPPALSKTPPPVPSGAAASAKTTSPQGKTIGNPQTPNRRAEIAKNLLNAVRNSPSSTMRAFSTGVDIGGAFRPSAGGSSTSASSSSSSSSSMISPEVSKMLDQGIDESYSEIKETHPKDAGYQNKLAPRTHDEFVSWSSKMDNMMAEKGLNRNALAREWLPSTGGDPKLAARSFSNGMYSTYNLGIRKMNGFDESFNPVPRGASAEYRTVQAVAEISRMHPALKTEDFPVLYDAVRINSAEPNRSHQSTVKYLNSNFICVDTPELMQWAAEKITGKLSGTKS